MRLGHALQFIHNDSILSNMYSVLILTKQFRDTGFIMGRSSDKDDSFLAGQPKCRSDQKPYNNIIHNSEALVIGISPENLKCFPTVCTVFSLLSPSFLRHEFRGNNYNHSKHEKKRKRKKRTAENQRINTYCK